MADGSRGGRSVVRAAGGLVWRRRGDRVEVAVVHRPRYDDWSLPKGKLDRGEPALVGACREVLEETGVPVTAGRTLGQSRYRVVARGREVAKTVRWWAMEAGDGAFTPTDEIDQLRWVSPQAALRLLDAGPESDPIRVFLSGPPRTRLLLLVRHATAGERGSWPGEDELRPLDRHGQAQAEALARLLPHYGPSRLLSAPLVRCTDTLRPLAVVTGLQVEPEPAFAAGSHGEHPMRTVGALRRLVAAGQTAVVCTQGEVLPDAVHALAEGGRVRLPEPLPDGKGSVWALAFDDDGCLVDADHTADPGD